MYKKVSKTDEITKRLTLEGKVRLLNSPEDLQKIQEMNKYMQDVRRDYINKSVKSERSASYVILNS